MPPPTPYSASPPAAVDRDRADGHVEPALATGGKPSDAAGINAARIGLQLADDLHGADLRCAGDRGRGKRRLHDFDQRGRSPGRHGRGHLQHRGILLHVERRRHSNATPAVRRAPGRCASCRRSWRFRPGLSPSRPATPRRRRSSAEVSPRGAVPFIGRDVKQLAVEAEEQLGRGRAEDVPAGIDIRPILPALRLGETMKKAPRIAVERCAKAEGVVHLVGVSPGDVILDAVHGFAVLGRG